MCQKNIDLKSWIFRMYVFDLTIIMNKATIEINLYHTFYKLAYRSNVLINTIE